MKLNKELMKGSFVLLVSFGFYNFFNFLFHVIMARKLSVADYGILLSLFSILYFLGVFSESMQNIITKYVASEKEESKIKNIIKRGLKKAFILSSLFFLGYAIVSVFLSVYMKIDYLLMLLNGLIVFPGIFLSVNRGAMQGKKKFLSLGVNMIFESLGKICLSLAFLFIGLKVYGAILGTVLSSFFVLGISFIPLRKLMKTKENKAETMGIYDYSKPAFIISATILFFYSIDVVIARMVFSADLAGSYAIASILAKTIFFATVPISKAMFPISAEEDRKSESHVLKNALVLVLGIIACALILFYLWPNLIIEVFSGKEVADAARVLFCLGASMGVLSIANLSLLYRLSKGRFRSYKLLPLFALVEIGLLFYFSANLLEFSIAFLTSSAIFLWGVLFLDF
jgi:O-antigen/teichoic acid export membrane protein